MRGFTLIELLVSISIASIVVLGATVLLSHAFRTVDVSWEALSASNEARRSMHSMTTLLRRAEPSALGGYPIATSTASDLVFYTNANADSAIEQVRFFLDNGSLKRQTTAPAGNPQNYSGTPKEMTLASGLTNATTGNSVFTYYAAGFDGTGFPLVQPVTTTDIGLIRIHLDIGNTSVESFVSIRNIL